MTGPHDSQPLHWAGAPLARARAGLVLVHGRGGDAPAMLGFAQTLAQPDVACVAPQAAGNTWYPNSFLVPLAQNEPGLSSGLGAIGRALAALMAQGLAADRIVLMGFSQGACLLLEYAARTPCRYGGIVALSGGLIGMGQTDAPPPHDKRFDYPGSLDGTPALLACSERDPHIPLIRVQDSARVVTALGAQVDLRTYPGSGHAILPDQVQYLRGRLARLVAAADQP